MTERRDSATWVDLQVAIARWLAYLVTAVSFTLIWFVDPSRITFSIQYPPILLLIAFSLIYALMVTGLALSGWLAQVLPTATVAVDLLLAAAAYYFLTLAPDPIDLAVDPLYFAALLPVVTSAIRFHWIAGVVTGFVMGLIRAGLLLSGLPDPAAPDNLLLAVSGVLVLAGVAFLSGYLGDSALRQGLKLELASARDHVQKIRTDLERAEALADMTSTLGATLNFERVIESALDVAVKALSEWGARGQLVGMVFLFEHGQRMRLAAARNLPRYESGQGIPGKDGIVARCLEEADIMVTQAPINDPELAAFTGISHCAVAAAVPLRAGFENYGAMVFATPAFATYSREQLDLFSAIANRATIALHNALLYQNLQTEKDRIVAIEEEAKRKLSRDLHDGPTQSISAVAMRLNFMRKALLDDRPRLIEELETIEHLSLQTVKEIRHMLFTLRPLVLETQGLMVALRTLVEKTQQLVDLNIQLREIEGAAQRLNPSQAAVVFHVIEEALGNARKYSEASLVEIRMWVEDNLFVAQVADNGVGFDTAAVLGDYESRGSLGMVNMRERAALVDGSLDVKSKTGKGTSVTLVVPLKGKTGR